MSNSPIPVSLSWNPFANADASPKHALASLLSLGGISAAELKTAPAPGSSTLYPDGDIKQNPVVSEVTTVFIRSTSAYTVNTDSAVDAAAEQASGHVISSSPGPHGDTNVVAADATSQTGNAGSISVQTKVTYADGSAETTTASLTSNFVTSGNGLALQRLDSIVGGASSEQAILQRLGIAVPTTAGTDAQNAPTDVGVTATVSSDIDVSLTYVAQGDQRSVSGVETGSAKALITTFDPTQSAYTAGGVLSTTQESLKFSGSISGGSLFSNTAAPWLSGSLQESTAARTTIPGANQITIDQESNQNVAFTTAGGYSSVTLHSQNAAQVSFSTAVNDRVGGLEEEKITLSVSDSDAESQVTNVDGTTAYHSDLSGKASDTISFTPIAAAPTVQISVATSAS